MPRNDTEKHGKDRSRYTEKTHTIQNRKRERRLQLFIGARSKGANGGVAVGLPHRNSSVLKQADLNKRQVKRRIRMDPRFSARVTKAC